MSDRTFTHLRCDMPGCKTSARLALDTPSPNIFAARDDRATFNRVDDVSDVRKVAAEHGWTTYRLTGLLTYTADYCPDHAGATSEGIRGMGGGRPTPINEPELVTTTGADTNAHQLIAEALALHPLEKLAWHAGDGVYRSGCPICLSEGACPTREALTREARP